jgi:hypothetical protein
VLIVNGTDDPVASLGQRLISSLRNVAAITLSDVDHLGLPAQAAFFAHGIDFLTTDATGSLAGAGAQRSRA